MKGDLMYDNIIKIYELEGIRDNIETIESTVINNEITLHIKLKKININCPYCEFNDSKIKEYVNKKITHSISTTRKVYINFKRRRFLCKLCNKTYYENDPFTSTNNTISNLTIMNILDHLKSYEHTFKGTANIFNVSDRTVINIFDKYVVPKRKTLPKVLCIDEVHIKSGIKYPYACVLLDFETNKIVDVLKTRHKDYLINYFESIKYSELKNVEIVVMDMWGTYRDVVKKVFPNAKVVVDAFHVVQLINKILDKKRVQIMNRFISNPSKDLNYMNDFGYLLKRFRWMITKNPDNIVAKYYYIPKYKISVYKNELLDHLLSSDKELIELYKIREEYSKFNRRSTSSDAKDKLMELINKFTTHELEEIRQYGYTLNRWKKEILNSFTDKKGFRYSNGKLESRNRQIKTIIRNGMGYKSIIRLRARIMYSINKDVPLKLN